MTRGRRRRGRVLYMGLYVMVGVGYGVSFALCDLILIRSRAFMLCTVLS